MKKIILFVILTTLLFTLSACKKSGIDDAYYAKITEDTQTNSASIIGYNGAGSKLSFTIESSVFDLSKTTIGNYIKIFVDTNDVVVQVESIEKSEVPENARLKLDN